MNLDRERAVSAIWNVLKIIMAIALIAVIISKTDLPSFLAVLGNISPGWGVLTALLFLSLTLLKAFQYFVLTGRRVGYPQVLHIVVIQNALSNFVAASSGIASYLALFKMEHGLNVTRAGLAFVLVKIGDLLAIWLLLLLGGIWAWPRIEPLRPLMVALLAGIGGLLLGFFAAVAYRQRFVSRLRALLARFRLDRFAIVARGMDTLGRMVEQDPAFVYRTIRTGAGLSMVYAALTVAWAYAGLRMFSLPIGVIPVVFVSTLLQLLSYLPIQVFGGMGMTEVTAMYLYEFFGFPRAEVIPVLLGTRLSFYVLNALVLLYLPIYGLFFQRPVVTAKE